MELIDFIKSWAPRVIFLGHVKLASAIKDGSEFSSLELDLTGKISRMICQDSDGIGYLYRGKGNQNFLSFKTSDEISCGTRAKHLKNKEILISEYDEDDNFITHWEEVFID